MREIPIEVLFTFPKPNYENPETRGPGLIITIGVFTTLVTIAIALRYYTRIALKRWYGLDDVFIGLAYVRYNLLLLLETSKTEDYEKDI